MAGMLKAGVSITEISPGKGIELAGYPHCSRNNTGIHDPLFASCIYLDNGRTKLAIVAMDILMYSKKYVRRVRKRVAGVTTIPAENIMICCSHTHSGPWASGMLELESVENGSKLDKDYVLELENKLVSLIIEAYNNPFGAKVGVGSGVCGKEQGVGGNRRDPDGPCDPEVWVIGVKDNNDNWKACFVKYALHPTLIHAESTVVTADYPCYIRKYLAVAKPDMKLLFAQGTSGDQSTRYFRIGQSFEEACRIGTTLGVEVNRVLDLMQLSSDLKIKVVSEEINIDVRKLPKRDEAEMDVRNAKEKLDKMKTAGASYIEIQNAELNLFGAENTLGYVLAMEKGKRMEILEDEIPAEVQVIGIGDARMVCFPGEIFVELGLMVKKGSPFEKTFVVELANGCLPGYVCTAKAYSAGGYEAGTSLLTARTGELLVNAGLKLINKTK